MFKKLAASVAVLTALSFNTQAFEIDTEACAGVEHIRDLTNTVVPYDPAIHTFVTEDTPVFYAGEEQIPHIEINPFRNTTIFVTNTTSANVSFFFNPVFHFRSNGAVSGTPPLTFIGTYSSSNNPLDGAGATNGPKKMGAFNFPANSTSYTGYAQILWDSSTCFESPPMITTVRQEMLRGSQGISTSYYHVNNGDNW
ncbi:hypothetical protein EYS14_16220 [Alteromonadaceae bacterium M269]|nr:hypothetical protein EYS14_16220 [Alteromonadaceae bacterium M269]